jgi:hypothetical protein
LDFPVQQKMKKLAENTKKDMILAYHIFQSLPIAVSERGKAGKGL